MVQKCWSELFTLGLAQCAQAMALSTILTAIVNHLQTSLQQGNTCHLVHLRLFRVKRRTTIDELCVYVFSVHEVM